MSETIFTWADGWEFRFIRGGGEIFRAGTRQHPPLSPPAAQLWWQLINGRRGVGEMIVLLEDFFVGTPGETAAYARKTLADLYRLGIIVPDIPGSAAPEPDTCIITFCCGDAVRYPATASSPAYSYTGLLNWLKQGLDEVGDTHQLLTWTGEWPEGCPGQEAVPYGFKPWCFDQARRMGFRKVLWLDGSARAIRSLDPLFRELDETGHLFFKNWHSAGAYCHDKALFTLGITREQAMEIPSIMGQVIGLNLDFPDAAAFLDIWHEKSLDRITFQDHGLWHIANETYIRRTGVKGHRHDQTAASVIAWRLGMLDFKFDISDFFAPLPGQADG